MMGSIFLHALENKLILEKMVSRHYVRGDIIEV